MMDRLLERLKNEYDADKALLSEINRRISDAPEGGLRVSLINKHMRYYWTKDGVSKYIRKKDEDLARHLADKEYLLKLSQVLEQEMRTIEAFLKRYQPSEKTLLFSSIHPAKQKLITPVLLPDEAFAAKWKTELEERRSRTPNGFPINRSFQTKGGEVVRSKSEKIIADLLFDSGVPYVYEAPLFCKHVTLYPDFTLLNVRTRTTFYWEHFGMMENADYTAGIPQKLNAYDRSGIHLGETLIATFETVDTPIDIKSIRAWISRILL
jgi:hypothetical protein